jgi:hypothetical protein
MHSVTLTVTRRKSGPIDVNRSQLYWDHARNDTFLINCKYKSNKRSSFLALCVCVCVCVNLRERRCGNLNSRSVKAYCLVGLSPTSWYRTGESGALYFVDGWDNKTENLLQFNLILLNLINYLENKTSPQTWEIRQSPCEIWHHFFTQVQRSSQKFYRCIKT